MLTIYPLPAYNPGMPLIKRYSNRKLYDTEAKQYVALEQIADLIRGGKEIQVIDNVTGEDLTAVILTQIILGQEKRQAGWLPAGILAGLLRARSQTLHSLRQSLTPPQEWRQDVDAEIGARIQTLLERGQLTDEEAARWREKLIPGTLMDENLVVKLLAERGVPTRKDLRQIFEQLAALAATLEEMAPAADRGAPLTTNAEGNFSARDASDE
jgi:polyhydroxyalkanoate synthesis repressor PhaR